MIILREASKKRIPLQEAAATAVGLEDVIGTSGFTAYAITGPKLVQGPGSVSKLDLSLVSRNQTQVSFPVNSIKSIGIRSLNVLFWLKDGTVVEFLRH